LRRISAQIQGRPAPKGQQGWHPFALFSIISPDSALPSRSRFYESVSAGKVFGKMFKLQNFGKNESKTAVLILSGMFEPDS
jgi:hypothetical protein